ncbi:protein asteroid isoform X1 [Neodiprion pinetum]|uniref:protein asteroid isoform X1 n=2 Tax=Neodiprion pinetum TaxID=441929 RepID=UPI001EDDD513|nr:protein asteroid isoform X1 [Neodiprion pinetum]
MGIRGLTTYIARHSEQYLEPFELYDTYLVIDGNSIACQLYNWHARCNCAFGGDYDRYAEHVREFFDNLTRCKITPLVLIDGGYENKKIKTTYSRLRSKIKMASYFTHTQSLKFFPILMKEVFRDVMDEKRVKYAQCAFEADDEIAAVARVLGCPVLSYDSDFFVYGVLYIPYNTLDAGYVKGRKTNGYVKRCKIYRVEKFLNSFGGLDRSLLPLIATLLGNDYIKRGVFKQFFQNLKLSKLTKKNSNEQQRRIAALLNWLQPYTLNSAVRAVLSRIQKEHRRRIMSEMEAVIAGYTSSSPRMLAPLGFSKEYVTEVETSRVNSPFKFQEDFNSLEVVEDSINLEEPLKSDYNYEDDQEHDDSNNENDNDNEDDNDEDDEDISDYDEVDLSTENFLSSAAPPWFIAEYSRGQYPPYFIDMMYRQLLFCPPQIEDYFYPASHLGSLKIISVIFELLTSNRKDVKKNLEYVIRDDNNRATRYQLQSCREIFSFNYPPLKDLNTLPLVIREGILTCTLETPKEFNTDLVLPEWRLYLATIIYWSQQGHEPLVTSCHIYALLCSMLFGIIDQNLGFCRSAHKLKAKYNDVIKTNAENRKSLVDKVLFPKNTNSTLAGKYVTPEDCFSAANFFIPYFNLHPKMSSSPKAFNVTVVHSFSQFQSCLRYSMHLNALLGYPYMQPKVAEVYNGTLLYNLYHNFKKRNSIEAYINVVLKDSPSLLQIFNTLTNAIKQPLATVFEHNVNQKRRRKNKNKSTKVDDEEYMSCASGDEILENNHPFIDPNNPFCVLNAME